jgi:hypothetical protein
MSTLKHRWAHGRGHFKADPKRSYFICVENGNPDGSDRTSHFWAEVDERLVLTPLDFQPHKNPPAYVAKPLHLDCDHDRDHSDDHDHDRDDRDDRCRGEHHWEGVLFDGPARVGVSIRVAK